MAVGAAPNLSGGLAMSGMSHTMMDPCNGIGNFGLQVFCWCNGMPIISPGDGSGGSCGNSGSGGGDGGGGSCGSGGASPSGSGGGFEGSCPKCGCPIGVSPGLPPAPYGASIIGPQCISVPQPTAAPPCVVAQGLPLPPPVPGAGSTYTQGVELVDSKSAIAIPGFSVSCAQTGVTLSSGCGYVNFNFSSGGTVTYSTPGGSAITCGGFTQRAYNSALSPYTILRINEVVLGG